MVLINARCELNQESIDEDMKNNDIILSDKAKVNERKRNYIVKFIQVNL